LQAQIVPKEDTTFKVILSSPTLDFTVVNESKPKGKIIYLKNEGEETYKVSLIDDPGKYFKIELDKKLKPGKSIRIKVKPKLKLPEEGIKTCFTIKLTGKEETRITIPLVYQGVTTASGKK